MDQYFFHTPFAVNGDKTTIPRSTQSGGQVSFNEGWGPDYQKNAKTDANAKFVERQSMNYVLNSITTAIKQYQTNAFPEFITSADNNGVPYSYGKGVVVRYRESLDVTFVSYVSLADNNTVKPGSDPNYWRVFDLSKYLLANNNLSDISNVASARENLDVLSVEETKNLFVLKSGDTIGWLNVNDALNAGGNINTTQGGVYDQGQRVYSPNNPPPYPAVPVTSVNGSIGNVMTATAALGSSGWHRDGATGMITQWGIITRTGYVTPVTFPTTFPNGCMGVFLTLNTSISDLADSTNNLRAVDAHNSGFTYASAGVAEISAFWFAIGY